MKRIDTHIEGCFIIEPSVFQDKRGYFLESYNKKAFDGLLGYKIDFVQDNESFSSKGVLRGLHYQIGEFAQAKLVRVIKGSVLDIAVDIRKGSKTFGKSISVELSEENKRQFFVPRGFAHGFIVLSEIAIFSYKCDNFYNKESEGGIMYNDQTLGIDWKMNEEDFIVSEKDQELPKLEFAKL